MDEPFSALDVLTAENLRGELLELWLNKKMPTSAIFIVTHNIEEAVMLADRVMVLGRNPARDSFRFQYPAEASARPQVGALCGTGGLHLQSDDGAGRRTRVARRRDHGGNHSAQGRADAKKR